MNSQPETCKHTSKRYIGSDKVCTECGERWEILDDWDLS